MKSPYFHSSSFRLNWLKAFNNKVFCVQLILTGSLLILLAGFVERFFNFIQLQPGIKINDVLLNFLSPRDLSIPVFSLVYFSILLGLSHLSSYPFVLLKALQTYAAVTIIRVLSIYFIRLEAPDGIIPLKDPFTSYFFYGNTVITKDLFFSGHISTLFLIALFAQNKLLQSVFLFLTFFCAVFILVQHVHYTIDVIAAPIVVLFCYLLIKKIPLGAEKMAKEVDQHRQLMSLKWCMNMSNIMMKDQI